MKKPPEARGPGPRRAAGAALALAGLFLVSAAVGQTPDVLSDDWYLVELLVFAREDAGSLSAERWEPLPTLSYPERYRYLIDPERAQRRVAESVAFASRIDDRGIQRITVPAPVELLEMAPRPDAHIGEPYAAPDPNRPPSPDDGAYDDALPAAGNAGAVADGGPETGEAPSPGDAADAAVTMEEEPSPGMLLVVPEQLLPEADLAFGGQARTLRRRGERVLFHGHWWSRLPEGGDTLPLVLDRAADMDASAWPALQGSVHIYRSRFLHMDVDLWLNTMASYLPEGWQIEAPPLAAPSLLSTTLAGDAFDPWAPAPPALPENADIAAVSPANGPAAQTEAASPGVDDPGDPLRGAPATAAEEPSLAPTYPWRHAITHRQSRRMRSGETHYLDHPVIGVIVRIRPPGEGLLPFADDAAVELEFRERHGLPVDYVLLPDETTE